MKKKINSLIAIGSLLLSGAAYGIDFDFSGTFTTDDQIGLFDFTVGPGGSDITIFSSSWLDGDNDMGFDPILALWDSAGDLIHEQDDGGNIGSTFSNGIEYDHGEWDTYFTAFLAAGDYKASIAQFDNFANGTNLSDGFFFDGNPNFTFDEGYGAEAMFNGVWSDFDARTGDWEFHILDVAAASGPSVPDSGSTFALLAGALFGAAFFRRKVK